MTRNSSYQTQDHAKRITRLLSLSAIVLGTLTACSNSGVDSDELPTNNTINTPITVSSSVQEAEVAGEDSLSSQTSPDEPGELESQTQLNIDLPAAANPEIVKPMAPDDRVVEVTSSHPPTSVISSGIDSTSERSPETEFVSVTTPGFKGEVLDDAIRISWLEDSAAQGYNVYRQAGYYTTVRTTEFIDSDVFDDNYYYEIKAFDDDDNFWYIATGLTVKARTLGRIDPEAAQPKDDLLQDYELVFADEFNNSVLDTSKWNTSFLWGQGVTINDEKQYYVAIAQVPDFGFNPFSFDGEHLTINTIKTPAELSTRVKNKPYLSGLITSYDAFKFIYGYAETRAKFTHGRGYWPAFWLLNASYVDAKPEIDIMEFIGDTQDVIYHTYHYYDTDGQLRSTKSFPVAGIDYTADFHTFGVEWMPDTLIFYIDGIETHRIVDANVSQQEMYVIANQAIGGTWAGPPDATTPFPGKYMIDYIRVYQRTTPYQTIQSDQSTDLIPLFVEHPDEVLPNKRPPIWLWREGYPDGQ